MRRNRHITSAVAIGVLAVATFIVPSSATAAPAASSWTQNGYNGARNEANLTEKTLTVGNAASVGLRRTYTGPPTSSKNLCSVNGTLVTNSVVSGGYLFTSVNETVARTSLKTGVTSWRRNPLPVTHGMTEGENIQLAVAGGLVFVTMLECESQSDPIGDVYALNANNGAIVWQDSSDPAATGIGVSGNYLVLSGGSDTSGYGVLVYRPTTGAVVWQHIQSSPCDDAHANALIEGGQVISCTNDDQGGPNTITANALATGSVTWTEVADGTTLIRGDTDAVATGHQLYLNAPQGIIDVNPKNGATKFTMAGATTIGAVSSSTAYGTCGNNLCAFNIADGSPAWSVPNPTSGFLSAWADNVLYTSDGSSVNASNGALLVRHRTAGPVVIADGYVIVRANGARVIDIYGLPNS